MAPRILIFSIAMGADKLFYLKIIATNVLTFFGYIISVLAIVLGQFVQAFKFFTPLQSNIL